MDSPAPSLDERTSSQQTTEQVLQRHLQAFVGRDLDRLAADYTEDAIVVTVLGTFCGRQQIRSFFENFLTEVLPVGSTVEIQQQLIEGEIALLVWSGKSPGYDLPFVADTFVIRNGAITAQTGAGVIQPISAR